MYVESYQWQIGLERISILPLAPCGFDTPYLSLPPLEIAMMIPYTWGLSMLLGEGLVGVNHRAIPTSTQRKTIKETPHASNLLHNGYHMCMLRDLQTSAQVFLKFTITLLA